MKNRGCDIKVSGISKVQSCQDLSQERSRLKDKRTFKVTIPSSLRLHETKKEVKAKGLSPWNNETIKFQ